MSEALSIYNDIYVVLHSINENEAVLDARTRLTQACLGNSGLQKGVGDYIDETLKIANDGNDLMSVQTIKQASPLTEMFGSVIKLLSINDDDSTAAGTNAS